MHMQDRHGKQQLVPPRTCSWHTAQHSPVTITYSASTNKTLCMHTQAPYCSQPLTVELPMVDKFLPLKSPILTALMANTGLPPLRTSDSSSSPGSVTNLSHSVTSMERPESSRRLKLLFLVSMPFLRVMSCHCSTLSTTPMTSTITPASRHSSSDSFLNYTHTPQQRHGKSRSAERSLAAAATCLWQPSLDSI